MSRFLYFLTIVLVFTACNNAKKVEAPQEQTSAQSKHSAGFNTSVQAVLQTYYGLTEAMVSWDSVTAASIAKELNFKLDSLQMVKKEDSASVKAQEYIANAKKELTGIMNVKDITSKRHALNALSDDLYQFLNEVKYDQEKLYLHECPMAFNDQDPGLWLSKSDTIRNPYLGLHHPHYGKAMLECGENKSVLNYTGAK